MAPSIPTNDDNNDEHDQTCQEISRLESILPKAKALVFDCDGTLLDTMPIYYESWKRTCDEVGLSFPIERFYAMAGMPVVDIFQVLIDEWNIAANQENGEEGKQSFHLTAEECEGKKKAHHADIEAEGKVAGPIDVVVDIVKSNHGKIPMAVASSGWRDHVMDGLKRNDILHLFDAVVTADEDEVKRGKPDPDIFLVAAKRLGVDAKSCIGFEDADMGMQALESAEYLYSSDVRLMRMYPRNVEKRARDSK